MILVKPGGNEARLGEAADAWFRPGRFSLILAGLIFAAFPEVVLGLQTFFFRDFGYFGYPLAHYHRESFWRAETPLWNPLNNCGLPFLAQWNTLVLYPGSLIYLLFPLSWSLSIYCLTHQFWAGLGMYFLARRWTGNRLAASVAGLAFAFNGLTLNCLMWPNNIAALGWMPWVVLLVEGAWREGGRKLLLAALVSAMQMLAGAPEIIVLTWLLLLVIGTVSELQPHSSRMIRARRIALVVLLTTGLTAAQLIPFSDLLRHSQRDHGYGDSAWAMPAWGWANFLVPMFGCFRGFYGVFAQYEQYWVSSYYVGVGVVALALFAIWQVRERRVWLLATIVGLSLVLAIGDAGYLYHWLRRAFPSFGFARYPVKFVTLAVFCLPLLAAFGVKWIQELPVGGARQARRSILFISVVLLALIVGIVCCDYFFPLFKQHWPETWKSGLSRTAFLMLTVGTIYALSRPSPRQSMLPVQFALLLLIDLDGLTHMPRQNPTFSRGAFEPGLLRLSPQPRHGTARAMISPAANLEFRRFGSSNPFNDYVCSRLGIFANCNLLDEIPKLDGFYSLYLREAESVRSVLYAATNSNPRLAPLCDFLGVAHVTAPGKFFEWESRAGYLPFTTVGQMPLFADESTTLLEIASANFNPRQVVYLPLEAKALVPIARQTAAKILASRHSAQRMELEVQAEESSLLVVSQAFYHPWQACVDGQQVRLWRANHAYQTLTVPAGRHRVELVYEDRSFRFGAVISCFTFAGCLVFWIRLEKSQRQSCKL